MPTTPQAWRLIVWTSKQLPRRIEFIHERDEPGAQAWLAKAYKLATGRRLTAAPDYEYTPIYETKGELS